MDFEIYNKIIYPSSPFQYETATFVTFVFSRYISYIYAHIHRYISTCICVSLCVSMRSYTGFYAFVDIYARVCMYLWNSFLFSTCSRYHKPGDTHTKRWIINEANTVVGSVFEHSMYMHRMIHTGQLENYPIASTDWIKWENSRLCRICVN